MCAIACAESSLPVVTPIEHASVLLTYNSSLTTTTQLYSDPVDAKNRGLFDKLPSADIIVITHSHGDHLQPSTIFKLMKETTQLVVPQDVAGILLSLNGTLRSQITILGNGNETTIGAFTIHAVPMYNTGPNPHHPEGKWNGYVIQFANDLVYLSGDTSYIPEMEKNFGFRQRFNRSFLCMNLPYTMGVEEAANATDAFKPQEVTPYHYRNADQSLSNLTLYKYLVNQATNPFVDVILLNFYPFGPFAFPSTSRLLTSVFTRSESSKATSLTPSDADHNSGDDDKKKGLGLPILIGAVVGAVVVTAIVTAFIVAFVIKRRFAKISDRSANFESLYSSKAIGGLGKGTQLINFDEANDFIDNIDDEDELLGGL